MKSNRPQQQRLHFLTPVEKPVSKGPVVYWMWRDQRAEDNWALAYAQEQALQLKTPLIVAFTLAPSYLGALGRSYVFMLQGLRETARRLEELRIGFVLLQGDPADEVGMFAEACKASLLITDFCPLRPNLHWQERLAHTMSLAVVEVDAHNIVPCRMVSDKEEYAARTIRPKIHRLLPEFLIAFPEPVAHPYPAEVSLHPDWDQLIDANTRDTRLTAAPAPGTAAAHQTLDHFIRKRLSRYNSDRNDPNAKASSGLSPYLHFGQIAPQRVALRVLEHVAASEENAAAFLEELIVRRELSDNFCLHNQNYDAYAGLPRWGRDTLDAHRTDQRDYVYSRDVFVQARTHDPLWNAAQRQLLASGCIHGYMRMYWAKKILEWTPDPETALEVALWLNNGYGLDGRDPNGYVGVLWSVGGLHDRAFKKRQVFGKIRFMNAAGCKRKFDIQNYMAAW